MVGEQLRDPLTLQRVTARVLSLAADREISALPVVSTRSPSLALLTKRKDVVSLIKAVHYAEIECGMDNRLA